MQHYVVPKPWVNRFKIITVNYKTNINYTPYFPSFLRDIIVTKAKKRYNDYINNQILVVYFSHFTISGHGNEG